MGQGPRQDLGRSVQQLRPKTSAGAARRRLGRRPIAGPKSGRGQVQGTRGSGRPRRSAPDLEEPASGALRKAEKLLGRALSTLEKQRVEAELHGCCAYLEALALTLPRSSCTLPGLCGSNVLILCVFVSTGSAYEDTWHSHAPICWFAPMAAECLAFYMHSRRRMPSLPDAHWT